MTLFGLIKALQCLQLRSWEELREENRLAAHCEDSHSPGQGKVVFWDPRREIGSFFCFVFFEKVEKRRPRICRAAGDPLALTPFFLVFTPGRGEHLIGFLRSR